MNNLQNLTVEEIEKMIETEEVTPENWWAIYDRIYELNEEIGGDTLVPELTILKRKMRRLPHEKGYESRK